MKIRNPELVEEEIKRIEVACEKGDFMLFVVLPFVRQFWSWVKLDSNICVSETLELDKQAVGLMKAGYPPTEVYEFILMKLLKKDATVNPKVKEFLENMAENNKCGEA